MQIEIRIGERVSGTYHGAAFVGRIAPGSSYGFAIVRLEQPVVVYGVERSEVGLHADEFERAQLRACEGR